MVAVVLFIVGVFALDGNTLLYLVVEACACTDSAACWINDDDDSDFCSIASDMLRFLRMGFLTPLTNELVFDRRLAGSEFCCEQKRFEAGCMGP